MARGCVAPEAHGHNESQECDARDCFHCDSYWIGDNRVSNVAGSLRKLNIARRRVKAFGLTRRELEIVAGDCRRAHEQVAKRSSISESTVKRHVTHIFDKLGASNRIEVALFAAHHRLLECI
jgi:DNA-binding NarL/FixJ family response regulator